MSSKTEVFGENASKILKAIVRSKSVLVGDLYLEVETKLSNDKVKEALGWLIEARRVDGIKEKGDKSGKIKYALVDGTYEKNASVIWRSLSQNGTQNITQLKKSTNLDEEDVHGALGWLARDNDIDFVQKGSLKTFSAITHMQ